MAQRLGTSGKALVGVLISAFCLWLAFRSVPLDDLAEALGRANYWWLAPAAVAQILAVLTRAKRWQVLLLDRASYGDLFWAQAIGFLGTNVLPLRAGEAARIVVAGQLSGLPLAQVGASAILERVLDVLTVLLIIVSLLGVVRVPATAQTAALVVGAAAIVAIVGVLGLLLLGERSTAIVAAVVGRLPIGDRWRSLVVARWRELIDGFAVMRRPSRIASAALWSAATWACSIGTCWAVVEGVKPGASFVEPAFAIAAISLGLTIPSSPGFVGVFQYVGQQALVTPFPDRYNASEALSIALLTHMVYYVLTTGLGAVGLARLGMSLGAVRGAKRAMPAGRAGAV